MVGNDGTVLHLSELTKLSNLMTGDNLSIVVLHLSELTKLSNSIPGLVEEYLFYIFLN